MPRSTTEHLQTWLAGLWAGLLLGVGAVAAPSLFVVLERSVAGQGAGQMFTVESRVSLILAMILFLSERWRMRQLQASASRTVGAVHGIQGPILLVLGALFLTVFGEFALRPMIQAAKAGQPTPLSFGALHGLSAAMYWSKTVLVMLLAWRLGARASQSRLGAN